MNPPPTSARRGNATSPPPSDSVETLRSTRPGLGRERQARQADVDPFPKSGMADICTVLSRWRGRPQVYEPFPLRLPRPATALSPFHGTDPATFRSFRPAGGPCLSRRQLRWVSPPESCPPPPEAVLSRRMGPHGHRGLAHVAGWYWPAPARIGDRIAASGFGAPAGSVTWRHALLGQVYQALASALGCAGPLGDPVRPGQFPHRSFTMAEGLDLQPRQGPPRLRLEEPKRSPTPIDGRPPRVVIAGQRSITAPAGATTGALSARATERRAGDLGTSPIPARALGRRCHGGRRRFRSSAAAYKFPHTGGRRRGPRLHPWSPPDTPTGSAPALFGWWGTRRPSPSTIELPIPPGGGADARRAPARVGLPAFDSRPRRLRRHRE